MTDYDKLRAIILGAGISISLILVLIKAIKFVIPTLGGMLVGFTALTIKAYLARKAVDKIEEKEDKVMN